MEYSLLYLTMLPLAALSDRFFPSNRVKSLYLMHKTKAGYGSKTFLTYFNKVKGFNSPARQAERFDA
jgi:hypothetical protein